MKTRIRDETRASAEIRIGNAQARIRNAEPRIRNETQMGELARMRNLARIGNETA